MSALGRTQTLAPVVLIDLLLAKSKEARGIVVEYVSLLPRRQEWRILDRLHRWCDDARPDHLVRTKQGPVTIGCIHNAGWQSEMGIGSCSRTGQPCASKLARNVR